MNRMPTITTKLMIRFLHNLGFEQVRQKGSHKFFRHADGRTATVADHKGEDSGKGITNKILKDTEVTKENFLNWSRTN
ncbi:type II toxin-antitoxin system HicA family toxin [bacterium]|nr:type II toxin-antitoxin system HicA family toxin [bacterium]